MTGGGVEPTLSVRGLMTHFFTREGVVKAVNGISFDVAPGEVEIITTERQGTMPHNGYRPFDPSGVAAAFPDFAFTRPEDGFARLYAETADG